MAVVDHELAEVYGLENRIPANELFEIPERHITYDIPTPFINVAHQVRPAEDYGNMGELVESIQTIGLEQPVRVARWPLDKARKFVQLNNTAYPEREPRNPDNLVPLEDGTCLVVVYGHRRLAAGKTAGLETIPAKISDDPSFHDVLKIQTAENLHNRPQPVAFARGLNQVYQLGAALGAYESLSDFARRSGISTEQARNALRFCALPQTVQNLVIEGKLSYATGVQVSRVIPAVQSYELLQMQIGHEQAVEEGIRSGEITPDERDRRTHVFEVDKDFLDQRVVGVINEVLGHIQKNRLSAKNAEKYISTYIRGNLQGVAEIPLLSDEVRRKELVEAHGKRARTMVRDALGSFNQIATATALYGESIPEEIRAIVSEKPIQGVLSKTAQAAQRISETGTKAETRNVAFAAGKAIQELVEIDAVQEPTLVVGMFD